MKLIGVEISRLGARRVLGILSVVALLGIVAGVGFNAWDNQPPSAVHRAEAVKAVERHNAQGDIEREREDCRERRQQSAENGDVEGFDCDSIRPMTADDYLAFVPYAYRAHATDTMVVAAVGLALAAFLIGASFLGGDITTQTLGTQLLFEPRRTRVFAAKAIALSITTAVLGAVGIVVTLAGMYGVAWRWGDTSNLTSGFWVSTGLAGLRGVVVVVLAALGGLALAALLRHTAAAVGVLAVYAVGGEFVIPELADGARRWMLSSNLEAWLRNGHEITLWDCPEFGGDCMRQTTQLSLQQGGLVTGGLVLGFVLLAWLAFRRRDIT